MSKNGKHENSFPKLSEKEFLILQMLINSGEMYGLEMIEASGGELKRGTIYVTLQRMTDKGYLASREEERPKPEIGIPRRIYSVTGLGERAFRAQQAAISAFAQNYALGGT